MAIVVYTSSCDTSHYIVSNIYSYSKATAVKPEDGNLKKIELTGAEDRTMASRGLEGGRKNR